MYHVFKKKDKNYPTMVELWNWTDCIYPIRHIAPEREVLLYYNLVYPMKKYSLIAN